MAHAHAEDLGNRSPLERTQKLAFSESLRAVVFDVRAAKALCLKKALNYTNHMTKTQHEPTGTLSDISKTGKLKLKLTIKSKRGVKINRADLNRKIRVK